MTMSAAVDVLVREQEELPPRSQQAVELVTEEVDRFRQLVEDLLEISRYDAGAVRLDLDDVGLDTGHDDGLPGVLLEPLAVVTAMPQDLDGDHEDTPFRC